MDFANEFKEIQRELRELKTATPGSGGGQAPNDGILTLQQNGTTIQTFSANQSSDATANFDIHGGIMTADNLMPTADTVAGWATALGGKDGVYCTFYSQSGRFDEQPSQYGFLITTLKKYDSSTYEIYQSWQMSGSYFGEFHRSGFANTWYGSWARFRQSATTTPNDLEPSSDTPAAWASLFGNQPGYYLTGYSGVKKFTHQPSYWGQLETIIFRQTSVGTNWEVYQRWHSQSDGNCYYRAGNVSGWFGSASDTGNFRTIRDSSVQIGTSDIANLAITNAKIANSTITNAKIANSTIGSGKIDWSSAGTISVTAASGFSITYNDSFHFGDLRFFSLKIYGSTSAGTRVNVATVASGYRPPHELALMASTGNNQSCNCFLRPAGTIAVQTSGAVTNNDIRIIGFFNA